MCILISMNTSYKNSELVHDKNHTSLLVLGGLLMLTAGVSFLPASRFGAQPVVHRYARLDLSAPGTLDQVAQDADNDGAVSWKEFIAGSLDIPATQAADQETTKGLASDPRTIAALNDPNNLTSSFSKNLYIASTVLQKNGVTDPANEQETINQLLKEEVSKLQPVTYTEGNVKVGTEDTATALKVYGNAVAKILDGFITEQSIVNDLTGLASFTESGDEADLAPLFISKTRVATALEKLLALRVPKSAVSAHVKVLNNIGTFSNTLNDLSRAYDDPVRATVALKRYPDDAVLALRTFPELSAFFKEKGLAFSAKEAGYVFIVGYTAK